jgi:acetyl esterase
VSVARIRAAVDPALTALMADLAARGLGTPEAADVGIAEARRRNVVYFDALNTKRADVAQVEMVSAVASDSHIVTVKVAVPHAMPAESPAVLYCHGGGYAYGDLDTHGHVIRALAVASGMPVFAVHYRRTPEHSWPAPLTDALAVTAAMRGAEWSHSFRYRSDRLMVVGDSAGAHLALATMLAERDLGRPAMVGAALIYGMYARRFDTWSHAIYGGGTYGLSTQRMRWFWDQLLAAPHGSSHPQAELLGANLAGLPPLALFAAECDCLLDDTLDFAAHCRSSGHDITLDLFTGQLHGLMHLCMVHEPARQAMSQVGQRLRALANISPV